MAENKKTSNNSSSARKRSHSRHIERADILKICAFWGIVLAAAIFVATGILNLIGVSSQIISIIDIIAKLALLVAVGIPAWNYVKGKGNAMRILFFVALIIYIAGCVMGVIRF